VNTLTMILEFASPNTCKWTVRATPRRRMGIVVVAINRFACVKFLSANVARSVRRLRALVQFNGISIALVVWGSKPYEANLSNGQCLSEFVSQECLHCRGHS
jgi:hypothetical protein